MRTGKVARIADRVRKELGELTPQERDLAVKALRDALYEGFALDAATSDPKQMEACVRCGSIRIIRKGRGRDGSQRWKCMNCNRTFGVRTNRVMGMSKLKAGVWMRFLECFVDCLSLRKCAQRCGVCLKTAFLMRQRVIECIRRYTPVLRSEAGSCVQLNSLRSIWDPQGKWADKEFRRYPESFPDVRLVGSNKDDSPLIGIELKGWYLLSKESEPSLRYKASADAVTEWDLICCVPWGLSNVLSGKPVVYEPYVEQAKFASDMRTYYWNHRRGDNSKRDCGIHHPETTPYPKPGTQYVDVPNQDGGGNFGRIARVDGLMADWVDESMDTLMAGIEAKYWVSFFKLFSEGRPKEEIEAELNNIARKVRQAGRTNPQESQLEERLLAHLNAIVDLSLK